MYCNQELGYGKSNSLHNIVPRYPKPSHLPFNFTHVPRNLKPHFLSHNLITQHIPVSQPVIQHYAQVRGVYNEVRVWLSVNNIWSFVLLLHTMTSSLAVYYIYTLF
jgi:hypothetical protein